jgi:hypothetical protein
MSKRTTMFGYRQVVFIQTTILIIIITLEVPLWGFSCMKLKYIRINRHRQMSLFEKSVAKIPIESKTTLKHCFEITNKIMVFHPILLCVRLILWTYLLSYPVLVLFEYANRIDWIYFCYILSLAEIIAFLIPLPNVNCWDFGNL